MALVLLPPHCLQPPLLWCVLLRALTHAPLNPPTPRLAPYSPVP